MKIARLIGGGRMEGRRSMRQGTKKNKTTRKKKEKTDIRGLQYQGQAKKCRRMVGGRRKEAIYKDIMGLEARGKRASSR